MSLVTELIDAHTAAVEALRGHADEIASIGALLVERLRAGGHVYLCGNGGSAADAQHLATELACRYETDRRALPAIALTTDSSMLTAASNDLGYARIFARQVEALARPGDVLVCISTSGNSPNVLEAARTARDLGVITLGLLGKGGGALRDLVEHAIVVPSGNTARIQECHIMIGHIWCALVDRAFSGNPDAGRLRRRARLV
jgi:phosphoheptose isomerase